MFQELLPLVVPGVETLELDRWTRRWIQKAGGKPAFLGYGPEANPFPAAICISINDEVIHGIPSKRKILEGDLVSLDCGIDLGGFISDQAVTVEAGKVTEAAHNLNRITQECLYRGILAAKAGDRLLQIARSVHSHAIAHGYGVVHQFCGHGVGFEVHEEPAVSNNPKGPNPRMQSGFVIAIEPMINLGTGDVTIKDDGWTVVTADHKLSAHWEHTVAIFKDHTEILTERLDSAS
jgi:methionyl aminopeptidase